MINFYNPANKLISVDELDTYLKGKVIWCGDFNAHSTLWGNGNDRNGAVIEEVMEMKNFVCLNDGSGTRVDVRAGAESAIDLTLVSDSLAGIFSWQVLKETTVGSDHYPIMTMIEFSIEKRDVRGVKQWCFRDADWDTFRLVSDQEMQKIDMNVGVHELNCFICKAFLEAASRVMKRKDGRGEKKIVPWWTQECDKVIKYQNRAFKTLKNNHSFQNFIDYKRLQATVKRTVKSAKRDLWRAFCNSVGRETRIQNIWSMIRRMNGMKRECDYPILRDGDIIAVTDGGEKANVLAKTFVKVHSSGNVSEEGRRGRDLTVAENRGLMDLVGDMDDSLNILFTKSELHRVLQKSKLSAPGKDQVCYTMLNQLSESAKDLLLGLYNRVWESGKLQQSWKEAVVVPIRKPGKDVTNPGNF